MNDRNTAQLFDDLIDYIIDYRDSRQAPKGSEAPIEPSSANEQLSVKIGAERKEKLRRIAREKMSDISKATREILDEYFDFYFGHGAATSNRFATAWLNPRESMKC